MHRAKVLRTFLDVRISRPALTGTITNSTKFAQLRQRAKLCLGPPTVTRAKIARIYEHLRVPT